MKGTLIQGKVKSEKLKVKRVYQFELFRGIESTYGHKIQNLLQIEKCTQSAYKNFNFSFFTFNFNKKLYRIFVSFEHIYTGQFAEVKPPDLFEHIVVYYARIRRNKMIKYLK